MDRFFMKLSLGYMSRKDELAVMARKNTADLLSELGCVVSEEEIKELKKEYHQVTVHDTVSGYMMDIIEMTRTHGDVLIGASTRGAMALYEASQVRAAFNGRDYVLPEDGKALAPVILAHRMTWRGMIAQKDSIAAFEKLVNQVPVPTEEK